MMLRPIAARGALLLWLAAALAGPAGAQVPLSPGALGVAGAVLGSARGHDALLVNPANLSLPGTPRWSIAMPQVTLGAALAGPRIADLPDLVRYNDLADERRDEIFRAIPAAGAEGRFDLRAPLLAFQRKGWVVGVTYGAMGDHRVSREVAELALYGYEQGRFEYRVAGTEGSQMTFWDVAVAYGDRIGAVHWGVTAHYLRGGTLARSWVAEPRINLAATDIDIDYVAVLSRGGNGFAVDVGAAYQPHRAVTLGAAVANAFAGIRWSDDLYLRTLHLSRQQLNHADPVDLYERYRASERPLDAADRDLARGATVRTLQEQAYLPTVLRVGAGWQALSGTHLGVSYYGAITGGRLAGSWDRMLGVGIQQRIPLMQLRAGYATDLRDRAMLSGGVSLGVLEVGVARLDDGLFHTAARVGWMGAVGLNVRTRAVIP